uniref:C2H2-type domain-containing protein n=1 Tax=Solanum lycopersicum TaxID=4081 RepID=A0A3Q7HP22_SOLLC
MANQGLTMNPAGIWYFQCRYCDEVFTSSQGLGGHQRKHMPQGTWKKGESHEKKFCPSDEISDLYHRLGKRKSTPTVLPSEGRFYRSRSKRNLVHPRSTFDKPQQATVLEKPASTPTPNPFLIEANYFIHFVKQMGINDDMNVGLATKDDISIP